ncbi:protein BREAST CANCER SUSCEPTIBILITY 2 homolog B-like [Phoenix dactylifera]|uniref:Protein BREAST CANCER SUSCEPTIBILITY 2 homolog B-like n=1 Tax=Phoenix dactylifera TaxID=42345 RepID=A0A8B9AZQ3_PHODC|nr:protein BREAST CANCER SUSCEPTIBILITY 2 homolog B-like [Phoenix dactylifera]XP_017695922.1 protein BREAST CANCER SUSCEPTIBILITY 2 homolog B-like [Phoenix dactylifera]XP_026656693.1 protein BREAST CANCER SUSCEPTIBILITY 2 homolog B-like [Phoenix dactylifera]XP_038988929.1 protein BREAST CANCER SUSCEPTIBILITY 2 homolog B-like [Phoenix dactylifera]
MPTSRDRLTWQILPTAGGHFRWSAAGGDPGRRPEQPPPETLVLGEENHPDSRLPSMEDLVIQARQKVIEGGDGARCGVPMFRTGLGRSVSVSESSIRKASSFLEGGDATDREDGGGAEGFPMFRTGYGKSVTVKESSMRKAAAVLEGVDMEKGSKISLEDGGAEHLPMFHTGSGKSVRVRQSSIRKASAVLEAVGTNKGAATVLEGGGSDGGFPMFCTGSGKSVMVSQSSIRKATAVLEGENIKKDLLHKHTVDGNSSFSDSLFQTGSGKTVNLSSSGLLRASALLGLEGHNDPSIQCFELAMDHLDARITTPRENPHVKLKWDVNSGNTGSIRIDPMDAQSVQRYSKDFSLSRNQLAKDSLQNPLGFELHSSNSTQMHIKFHTAGGRSIQISSDALQRARSLLVDSDSEVLQNDEKADQPFILVPKDESDCGRTFWNKENISSVHQNAGKCKSVSEPLPCIQSFANQKASSHPLQGTNSLGVMLDQVNIECRPSGGTLVDISNNISLDHANINRLSSEKKRLRRRSSVSPFKRPRSSRFTAPLNGSISSLATDTSMSENCCRRVRVSSHYPFQFKRKNIKDFFGKCTSQQNMLAHLPDEVKHMNADNALQYRFRDESGGYEIGPEAFQNMLLQSGASLLSATKEWVANHYKWIVWKLASLERCYPVQASGKYLTVSNVLEELKYRYEREVNYGHRSAIKKILDGDALPSSMMVLCISAIHYSETEICKMDDMTGPNENNNKLTSSITVESNRNMRIEFTDGWYSLDAFLDVLLSKQLRTGKLFVGQKLRIWGAGLQGWVGPVSPLEASKTVSLLIHSNGTYRAHWADALGLCKGLGAPLAFSCIKAGGGKVPRTLVGITRIYPVLYKERFPDGGSVVGSERMEHKALQLYHQRRSKIVDDIMSEQQDVFDNDNDSDEGANILKILEAAAEPEVLMADMSSEQLISFSAYQAKQKALRQSYIQKKIEKSFEDAGLNSRDVTPFMRVRVVGLTSKGSCRKCQPREGLITIWNPTEKQKVDLVEGKIYSVAGLMPLNFGTNILYLQARGSSTVWKPTCAIQTDKFEPFFTPRKSITLSNLGEVPLASEFDIAAVIVHVGDVYISGCQKKQWIFLTDGSTCSSESLFEGQYDRLLAVSFCSPMIDNDSSALFSHTYSGSTVGFFNLAKRARDQMNHLWVAEATENSTYCVSYKLPSSLHLKEAADSAQRWAKVSYWAVQKLRERVLCIIGGHVS